MSTTVRPYFEVNLGSLGDFDSEEEGILADIFRAALQDTSWSKELPKPKSPVLVARFFLMDADEVEEGS